MRAYFQAFLVVVFPLLSNQVEQKVPPSTEPTALAIFQQRNVQIPGLTFVGSAKLGDPDRSQVVPATLTFNPLGETTLSFENLPFWDESFPANPDVDRCGLLADRVRSADATTDGCKMPGPWFFPFYALSHAEAPQWSTGAAYDETGASIIVLERSTLRGQAKSFLTARSKARMRFNERNELTSYRYDIVLPGVKSPGSHAIAMVTEYSDYRLVGGIELPFSITQKLNGGVRCELQFSSAVLLPEGSNL